MKIPRQCVVDTNVATTANGANQEAGPSCIAASARALKNVMDSSKVYIDDGEQGASRIMREYRRNLNPKGQPGPGDMFMKWMMTNEWNPERVTRVSITPKTSDPEDFAELAIPTSGPHYDPSDRVFLAVSAAHSDRPTILQSFDCKWWGWTHSLSKIGVPLIFLCESEIAKKHKKKMGS